jgi:glycosyltransferase involved in cell wall biosynthesis
MNILYIWDSDYPWDIRVEKICTALLVAGHSVHIAARNLKMLPIHEMIAGIQVHRMRALKNKNVNYIFSFPFFFNPLWIRFVNGLVRRNNIQIIIVRDLPLAITGIWAGKKAGIQVVFDMAENYVELVRSIWDKRKFKGVNLIVRNPFLAKLVAYYAIKKFDHVLVVIDEAAKVVKKSGGNLDLVTIVNNTPGLEVFKKQESDILDEKLAKIKNRFSVIYVGGVTLGRGLQVLLQAMPVIIEKVPDFLFVIIGKGYAVASLQEMAKSKELEQHVEWCGWVDHKKIYSYISVSKIGVIPGFATGHTNTTIPNKIFDYMGCGIPVVASDTVPVKRVVASEQCGLTFKSGDSADLARVILAIHADPDGYGSHGRIAVQERYNWGVDSRRLLSVVDRFQPK